MSDYKTINYSNSNDENKKDKIYFRNVFSKVTKSEKNKQYQKLQTNIFSLSRDVKLLEDFVNQDKYGRNKKLETKKAYKNFIAKSNFVLQKKQNKNRISLLNIINNYINSQINKEDDSTKKKIKNKIILTKKLDKSHGHYSIYKTEIDDKSRNFNRNQLPLINFNTDKSSETILDTNPNNTNIANSSSIFPTIQKNSPKKLYLTTETKESIENTKKNAKRFHKIISLSKRSIDLKRNSFIREFPRIIDNNEKLKRNINRYEFSQSADKMAKMLKEKNQKIKNGIKYNSALQNLIDWEMKSKIKLARWKFGIAEIEKYFVDLNAYGKQEEEELLKRKTFYDIVEDLIDEIKQIKEEKTIDNIKDKHSKEQKKIFNDFDKDDKNKEEINDFNIVDNAINKHSEASKILEKIKIRRLNEERTRHIITNILVRSDLGTKAIKRSTDKLLENIKKEEITNKREESKNKKIKKKNEDEDEKERDTSIQKEKEEKEKQGEEEENEEQEEKE